MKPFGLKGKAVTCKYGCCFMYPEENAFSTAKKIVRRKQRKAERQAVKKNISRDITIWASVAA
ncbi:hypothetical protein FP371_25655 [Citrobacter freundii]|uniref:hypothetical protein n=1 Tax=Gammaproteobacteria TaxID=1236 RepID=UPI000664068E|nr:MULTISPECIES: hypothetical protein [Gammaproteobacteria]EEA2350769.1 hypothetical protein [Salmonella enterica subsp. enterica serovar Enteritidis]EEC4304694.1 hypothetical protein [Salmonella enterica subsp. enterica serovar Enteritidis]EEN2407392.1 hypothetical protein [Salmonella enterica subsp. enterica serovar Enteritidis]EES8922054.1 hypothetical protein [Escherichia coli]EES9863604.1 hypothetical protein [Escherichia coli]